MNPRVWLDIAAGGKPLGTVMFELYKDDLPRTCKNFVALCKGNKGVGSVSGAKLHLKGTRFHRVINNYLVQARKLLFYFSKHLIDRCTDQHLHRQGTPFKRRAWDMTAFARLLRARLEGGISTMYHTRSRSSSSITSPLPDAHSDSRPSCRAATSCTGTDEGARASMEDSSMMKVMIRDDPSLRISRRPRLRSRQRDRDLVGCRLPA